MFERIQQIAADIFGVSPMEIRSSSSEQNVRSWDSVRYLSLIVALEEEFDLTFDAGDLDSLKTIGQITSLVESKVGSNP